MAATVRRQALDVIIEFMRTVIASRILTEEKVLAQVGATLI